MAKRKNKTKKVVRRRRVSGVPGGAGMQLLIGSTLGAIGGHFARKLIASKVTLDAKILNAAFLAAGGMLAIKAKNPLLQGAGIGIGSAAAIGMGQSLGLLNGVGIGNTTLYLSRPGTPAVGSFKDVPRVGNSQQVWPTPQQAIRRNGGSNNLYAGVYGN